MWPECILMCMVEYKCCPTHWIFQIPQYPTIKIIHHSSFNCLLYTYPTTACLHYLACCAHSKGGCLPPTYLGITRAIHYWLLPSPLVNIVVIISHAGYVYECPLQGELSSMHLVHLQQHPPLFSTWLLPVYTC